MKNLLEFYENPANLHKMLRIINGDSKISLRIVDWFVTNFAKKYYTVYELPIKPNSQDTARFKVYNDYKLKLKAYSKRRFDPFCRWERISIPYINADNTISDKTIETTIGQLNFFKWAIENKIVDCIEENYIDIEQDMNHRNTSTKRNATIDNDTSDAGKTRKKREELSISACKCIKKEIVKIIVKF